MAHVPAMHNASLQQEKGHNKSRPIVHKLFDVFFLFGLPTGLLSADQIFLLKYYNDYSLVHPSANPLRFQLLGCLHPIHLQKKRLYYAQI